MTRIHDHELFRESNIDVLVGGTPCQSFSVAGLRKGMADPRGNLALIYLSIADRTRPRWLVWENVPGVLSSNEGRDFGAFIGALGQLGYGFAYRVLDAQYFGVPQRRRRVFVVGYLGDWRRAAAVLFERQSLSGYPAPSREEGQGVARDAENSVGDCNYVAKVFQQNTRDEVRYINGDGQIAGALAAEPGMKQQNYVMAHGQGNNDHAVAIQGSVIGRSDENGPQGCGYDENVSFTLNTTDRHAVAIHGSQDPDVSVERAHPIGAQSNGMSNAVFKGKGSHWDGGPHPSLNQSNSIGGIGMSNQELFSQRGAGLTTNKNMQARRLTPTECERLQGFPDGHTAIPWRGKEAKNCPDGPRYKALGNSMAVPVMFWIGKRIEQTEKGINEKHNAMQAGELPD